MKIAKKILFILGVFLFTGCGEEELVRSGENNLSNGFQLSYELSGIVSAMSRSVIADEEGEDRINSFYILFFDNSQGGNPDFVEVIDAKHTFEGSLATKGTLHIEFPENSSLTPAGYYKLLICTNIESYIPDYAVSGKTGVEYLSDFARGKHMDEVIAGLTMQISGVTYEGDPIAEQKDNSKRMSMSNLPMCAVAEKLPRESFVDIELLRSVSRFDVYCDKDEIGYELVSASIWNAYTQGYVWENTLRGFSVPRTERYYGVEVSGNHIIGSLYAFENYVKEPLQKDKVTTCLIVGLKRNGSEKVEYFRTNVITDAMAVGQHLYRNNVYRTTIKGVTGEGDENERGAYENGDLKLEIDINGWSLDEYGNLQYDGENILAIPTSQVTLSPKGESREYNIFTLDGSGKGYTLEMTHTLQGSGITAELSGKKLKLTAVPNTGLKRSGNITFTFGVLSVTMQVEQFPYEIPDFIELDPYELPIFLPKVGSVSQEITVKSSASWVAEIYNGTYFSFESGISQISRTEGAAGETFTVETLKENKENSSRYSFVKVSLKDKPEVNRFIVLEQAGKGYLFLDYAPKVFSPISAGGGSSPTITVVSSGPWSATVTINRGTAYFEEGKDEEEEGEGEEGDENENTNKDDDDDEETGPTEWSGQSGDSFIVSFTGLDEYGGIIPQATVTLTLDEDPSIKHVFTIDQRVLSTSSLVIQTRRDNRPGSVFDLNKLATYRYSYNLAVNMRNTSLFGPGGVVPMEEEYIFMKSKRLPLEVANIFQVTGYPSKAKYRDYVTPWWKGDNKRILFFADFDVYVKHAIDYFQSSTSSSGVSGYTVNTGNLDVAASEYRYFNPDLDISNKLVEYLLKEGPFTKGSGEIDPARILLQSKSSTNRGLTKYPDTFIPLIMTDTKNKGVVTGTYCVFGIDPTNRLIILTDPGIFGSRPNTTYPNRFNFDSEANEKFLNNFIAWMTRAATEDGFMESFSLDK